MKPKDFEEIIDAYKKTMIEKAGFPDSHHIPTFHIFELGRIAAIKDVCEFLRTKTMTFGGDWCMNNGGHWGEDYAEAIEEKFLKG
jgi:hypothetical protein